MPMGLKNFGTRWLTLKERLCIERWKTETEIVCER